MSNTRSGRGFSSNDRNSKIRFHLSEGSSTASPLMQDINDSTSPSVNHNISRTQRNPLIQSNTGVVRHHGNRTRGSNTREGGRQTNSNEHYRPSSVNDNNNNNNNNRRSSIRPDYAASNSTTGNPTNKISSQPPIRYDTLTKLLNKQPDEILAEMLRPNFQLKKFLNDNRMRNQYDWILSMTTLLEQVIKCVGSRERVVMILEQLPKTLYIDGVYVEVRKTDIITDQLRFNFIKSFLNISNAFLSMIPNSADDLTKIFERIELLFTKIQMKTSEYEETKVILDEVLERVNEIDHRKQLYQQSKIKNTTTTTTNHIEYEDNPPPPDDYRQLQIVPDVREILSEKRTYLRENIVDGVYKDPQHYLDIHFRLLRADFVGPLRDGIEQYLSKAGGKNFNVRIYENVRSLGPRLSPRNGIVYDLYLDPKMASKISWANSRRLIYGNLLVLTHDQFKSCAFVTIEDRSNIEKDFILSVKTLENVNMTEQIQIDLDDIDFSYTLTMIETMTYFEAYRPVLSALQSINIDESSFPLAPFLLKLTNEKIPPDYVTPTTTYDFTPLLVDPNSDVKTNIVNPDALSTRRTAHRVPLTQQLTIKEFRIIYKQSNQVERKFKSVSLLDTNQWPTSDELHLNPKQREALILALTHKVALIQGPPGTGKTFLGVRITEMLLYNRSVWCPPGEQSTPILMICHTNHALDQFLELIIKRLKINEGIIRVGNRCQNTTIQPFSLLNARRHVRENRAIPSSIYHQKHAILDKKTEAEEELKVHEHKMEQSRTNIIPLSSFMQWNLIDDEHISSLLAPYNDIPVDTALSDWLGLNYEYEQIPDDFLNLGELETSMLNMNMNDQEVGQQQQQQQQQEKVDDNEEEINEEEEEEQRRRDELEIDDNENMFAATIKKSQTTESKSTKKQILSTNDDDDGEEGKWTVVKKKPYDRRRLIKYIIQNPTTFNDQTVQQINIDLWLLPMTQRYDLYRYWLLKYQQYLQYSVREARRAYNQAASALAEYHQEEDYYILKDSVIVAMTTTCAAKYHNVLEKLQSKIVIVEEAAAIFEAHIITALSTKCEHLILIGDHVQLRPNPSVYHLVTKYHMDVSLFERFIKNNFPNVRLNIQHRMRPEIARLMKHFYDDLEDHTSVKTDRPSIRSIDSNIYFINHSNIETTVADGSSKRNEFEANYVIALAQYLRKQDYPAEKITILVMYLGQRQFIAKQTKNIKLLHGVRVMVTDNYQGEENDIIILSLVRSNHDKKIGFLKTNNRICVALSRARCGLFVIGNMNLLAEVEDMWKKIVKSLIATNEIGTGLCLSCRQHSKEKFLADKPESFMKRPEGGCSKPCDARLKCGHRCELMCHNYDYEHKEIVCRKKCNEILSCGHPCTKRCHVSTSNQHDPCRIPVEKKISTCSHTIRFQCARTPTSDDCTHPIMKNLSCGHCVHVPCRISSSPSELQRFSCPNPCNTMLACKHKCTGTCGSCHTGRLHIPCQQKCERSLICSHVCKAPCAANCPPCLRNCETRCVHSQCKKKCGELCIPCKEPCAYKCKHLQCTRLCSEPCNRGPCNEPCDKKLKCGHDCIGICGEPCPQQCRICNKLVVQEILFGTEEEPNARFVFLPDCRHIIEVTALDKFIENSFNNPHENTAIRFPECPRCKQNIRRCTRYMPIINQVHNLIAQVKKKILGNQSEKDLNERRIRLIKDFEQTEYNLKEINLQQKKNFFDILYDQDNLLSDDILILMKNILVFLNEIDKLFIDGRKKLPINTFESLISLPLNHIIKYLFAHPQYRNFAEQQINDIEAELIRIHRLIFIETLVLSIKQQTSTRNLKPDEQEDIDSMLYLTTKTGRFTGFDQQKFDSLVKKLEHLNNLPGLGITERERVAIVAALNLSRGHWYVCPKGHPYVITECGGANQESHCPECGERIGGQNHQLVSTNRHFGLMDDSQYAAWSDEANLNMILPNEVLGFQTDKSLEWLSKSRLVDENVRSMWESMVNMKIHIIAMLDSDNDGLRIVAIKFIEMFALVLSRRTQDSIVTSSNEQDFSLNLLQDDYRILR
ncbi:unnamed protein product [Rotaria sordida]|uniref:RZ-type domain-containing protein n=1 Tax=Rotaria sordida TaxID=392033 RepID=A0A813RBH0_9BILA|nr:unnamed protein product [Rotaria sordida]